MTAGLLRAIAAHRKICMVRQRSKKIKRPAVRWSSHLGPVFSSECRPFALGRGVLPQFDRFRTWRKIRKPDVVPVLRGVVGFGNATRGPPNRADPEALAASPGGAEPNNANGHSQLSVKEFPGRRPIEQTNSNGLDGAGLEVTRVDPHLAVFLGMGWLPVSDATACAAPDESQRLVTPGVGAGCVTAADDAYLRPLVIRPQGSVAAADRAVAVCEPAWPTRHFDANGSTMAGSGNHAARSLCTDQISSSIARTSLGGAASR